MIKTAAKIIILWAISGIIGINLMYYAVKYVDRTASITKSHYAYAVFGGPATLILGAAAWIGIGLGTLKSLE